MKRILLIIFFFLLFCYPLHSEQKSQSQKQKIDHLVVNPKNYIPENVKIETVFYANITSLDFKDIIVQGTIKDTGDYHDDLYYSALISYDTKEKKWKNVYHEKNPIWWTRSEVILGKIFPDKRDVAIFYSIAGNGAFLDYRVIGYLNGGIKILLENSDIEGGRVHFEGDYIIEDGVGSAVVYKWSGYSMLGTQLVATPVEPYSPNDKKIEYWVDEEKNVHVSQKEIKLAVGQKLIVVRTNPTVKDAVGRSCDWNILHWDRDVMVAKKPGTTVLKFSVSYCNDCPSAEIKITVVDSLSVEK